MPSPEDPPGRASHLTEGVCTGVQISGWRSRKESDIRLQRCTHEYNSEDPAE